jgi:hypothetical protein
MRVSFEQRRTASITLSEQKRLAHFERQTQWRIDNPKQALKSDKALATMSAILAIASSPFK